MADTVEIEINSSGVNDVTNPIKVERGTAIRFRNIMASQSMHVRSFSSSYFTSTSNLVVAFGEPQSKWIKTNAPIGSTTITIYDPVRNNSFNYTIEVVASITTPNPYYLPNFDTSYTGLRANEFVVSDVYSANTRSSTMIHLRSDDPEVRFRYVDQANNFYGGWVSDYFMNSTYRLRFQVGYRAPTGALESKTVTVRIGTLVKTVTLSTSAEIVPVSHEVIPFGHTSGSLSLLDVKGFFGGGSNLRDYFRKGRNVPDMPANSGIPTSGTIKLTDFRGAATAFFVAVHPSSHFRQLVTTFGSKSVGVGWNIWSGEIDDWDLGYSKFIKDNAEFRYTMTTSYNGSYGTTNPLVKPVLSSYSGSPGTWSSNNKSVSVTVTGQKREEFYVTCRVTMYARHKDFPSQVVSTSASLRVRCVGT